MRGEIFLQSTEQIVQGDDWLRVTQGKVHAG